MSTGKNAGNTAAMQSQQGEFVLENARGETVRSFRWADTKIYVIRRGDTRRIETVASLDQLDEMNVPYTVITETTPEQVRNSPVRIGNAGVVRWNAVPLRIVREHELADEKPVDTKKVIAWSAAIQLAVIALFAIAGLVSGDGKKAANEAVVTIIPQEAVEKIIARANEPAAQAVKAPALAKAPHTVAQAEPRKVVAPSETKIVRSKAAVKFERTSRKISARGGGGYKTPGRRGFGTNEAHMNEIGALAAFDQSPRVKGGNGGRGGLNLQAVGTEPGSGAGGRGYGGFGNNGGGGHGRGGIGHGSGQGMSNAMYGKGLIAAPFGEGSPAPGSGGYGTRGRAGGGAQGAGYGESTVVGSWKGTGPHGNGPAGSGWGRGGDGIGPGEDDGDASVAEGLDRSQVDEVISRNIGQIVYCYEQGLQRAPSLKGRVGVRFEIGPNGRVSSARVARSSLRQAQVEGCMISKLKSWAFPKPQGGVTVAVNYPFMLNRQTK